MPAKIWTKEKVLKEALKYTRRQDFNKNSKSAYSRASKDGYLAEACKHMEDDKWTREKLLDVARKYDSLSDFQRKENGAYQYSLKSGLKEEATSHMERAIKPPGYWDKERVSKEAKKYKYRTEFMRSCGSAYNKALNEGWLDEICLHMNTEADGYKHSVYSIINKRLNKVYVGITRQHFNKRIKEHKKSNNSSRSKCIVNLEDTEFLRLTEYIFEASEVKEVETKWVNYYNDKGFIVLNDLKQLGRMGTDRRKYSDNAIKVEALKYNRRVDFKNGSPRYYDAACSQRILEEVCSHMRGINEKNYWDKERIIKFAKECSDRSEFSKAANGAYAAAKKLGCLDEVYLILRSRLDMGWLKAKGDRIPIWLSADKYHKIWLENDKCGTWKMKSLVGVNLDKMIKRFKSGWVPSEDGEWFKWKDSIQNE